MGACVSVRRREAVFFNCGVALNSHEMNTKLRSRYIEKEAFVCVGACVGRLHATAHQGDYECDLCFARSLRLEAFKMASISS
jgi:hypothetical protein